MQSSVGNSQVYEDGDQRPKKTTGPQKGVEEAPPRYEAAPDNAHYDIDSKDQRSIKNRLDAALKYQNEDNDNSKTVEDPLAPALAHGNEPSRGAQKDAEIKADEEEYLKQKGKI
ncbi:hypothetical protein BDQ12DRAFT_720120 [Crucibulum laeve]|uniref:Uncharacterized protein n=1 Tax=Crucibulum laeve TaxID=68775 RepID=A0A5C3MLT2_9AGAR|nr:hypothetical protein BDQ12DRAFT_720120 [Crucibulum laeve]